MKYIGSKNRIAKYLLPILLANRKQNQYYVEPFVGGANIIDKVGGNRIASDNNEYLITLYHKLQHGYIPIDFISREDFYKIKQNKQQYPKEVVALCGILASYNGNWFRAYGGYSKTKSGKDRNYYKEGVKSLLKQVVNLKSIQFYHSEYDKLQIPQNSIIYCDPPYNNTDKTYSNKKFNYDKFYDWCRMQVKLGHFVYISEYAMPNDFTCIWSRELPTSMPNQKIKAVEKLFIHESQQTNNNNKLFNF